MPEDETQEYLPRNPGDLITAEDWNGVQRLIRNDIGSSIESAVAAVTRVDAAGNADRLETRSADDIIQAAVERAIAEIPQQTGYRKLFICLDPGKERLIEHGLSTCPLVDVYELDKFDVVCAQDEDVHQASVLFYLYQSGEHRLRPGTGHAWIDIEPRRERPFRIPWEEMLRRTETEYSDDTSLGDLEIEFWRALFSDPNDDFEAERYCHSPWFERCCREERTVASLKSKGDWDELWFSVRPRKTIHGSATAEVAPVAVEVVHYDLNTTGVKNLTQEAAEVEPLPLMVLLKV